MLLSCFPGWARPDCSSADSNRVQDDLTQAEDFFTTNGNNTELAKLKDAGKKIGESKCSAMSLSYAEFSVGAAYLRANDMVRSLPYVQSACKLAEGIAPEDGRWDWEFTYKGLLLRLLLQSDRLVEAQKLAVKLRRLVVAHKLDALKLQVDLTEDVTDEVLHDHLDRAKATERAIRTLAPENM